MTVLSDETQAYQALLEGHRADPDDDLLYQDMLKAKSAMEIAWLQCIGLTAEPSPLSPGTDMPSSTLP